MINIMYNLSIHFNIVLPGIAIILIKNYALNKNKIGLVKHTGLKVKFWIVLDK